MKPMRRLLNGTSDRLAVDWMRRTVSLGRTGLGAAERTVFVEVAAAGEVRAARVPPSHRSDDVCASTGFLKIVLEDGALQTPGRAFSPGIFQYVASESAATGVRA